MVWVNWLYSVAENLALSCFQLKFSTISLMTVSWTSGV